MNFFGVEYSGEVLKTGNMRAARNFGMQQFFKCLEFLGLDIDEEAATFLDTLFEYEEHSKGDVLVTAGEMNRSIFFIIEGSVRYFDYNEENADDRVIAVLDSGNFVVETTSFLQKKPAMLNIGCCQSSRLLVMKAHNLDRHLSSSYYYTFQEVVARVLALYFEYLQKVVTMSKRM